MNGKRRTKRKAGAKLEDVDEKKKKKNLKSWYRNSTYWLSIGALLFAIWFSQRLYDWHLKRIVITVFEKNKPLRVEYSAHKWGTLKSGYYLGLKSMSPFSVTSGLMWFQNSIVDNTIAIRHWCNQGDALQKYTWLKHDFDTFGVQEIIDDRFRLTTKVILNDDDGWSVKVSVDAKRSSSLKSLSLLWYFSSEAESDYLIVDKQNDARHFYLKGKSFSVGHFVSQIDLLNTSNVIFSGYLSPGFTQQPIDVKETVLKNLYWMQSERPVFVLRGGAELMTNLAVYQVIAIPPFEFVVRFKAVKDLENSDLEFKENIDFEEALESRISEFDSEFEAKFSLKAKGFKEDEIEFAKSAVSNMLGGVGYFYGSSVVQSKYNEKPIRYGPLQLLTAVPSRSFFPRGFLWDEGFHNLLISQIKPKLSVEIIKSWLNLMNVEGWIPREIILGADSEARVPPEFIVQKNTNGNPPTLFLSLKSLLDTDSIDVQTINDMFPRLELWYNWFNTTQIGLKEGSYRWRGRSLEAKNELNAKTLTSGLDDYPRASHPSDDEMHLDLRCWMAFSSRIMAQLAMKIAHPSAAQYASTANLLDDNIFLDKLHWSPEHKMYCDFGLNTLDVKLVKTKNGGPKIRREMSEPRFGCVPHFGYVSLFPLILNVIDPDNPRLLTLLNNIKNPALLWSPFGLRSLAKSDRFYQKFNTEVDPPYWRGAVWINLNYLVLKALKHYSSVAGPYKNESLSVYTELRHNLVSNVFRQYVKTGYIWEQYDDRTGQGKGSHPFTGWSALVVLVMSEKY